MAVLHGDGDFMKTVGIATSAGYDCDNQAATCGGLMGVMPGAKPTPAALTREGAPGTRWEKPFNDAYIHYSRDGLPIHNRISDLVERIANIAEQACPRAARASRIRDGCLVYMG